MKFRNKVKVKLTFLTIRIFKINVIFIIKNKMLVNKYFHSKMEFLDRQIMDKIILMPKISN